MQKIVTICVCGAGTMGAGIALMASMAGYQTIQFDLNKEALKRSESQIQDLLNKWLAKQKITQSQLDAIHHRIVFTNQIEICKADLIIEAIVESLSAKSSLFQQLASINEAHTLFASNTSSIAIHQLAKSVPNNTQILGMHFFNPATLMKLVEIVVLPNTSSSALEAIQEVCEKMGKRFIICKDSPGFVVNRVARPYYLEALSLVEQGLTSPEQVDKIMESMGFKMGPFALMDLIGIDINYQVSLQVWESLGKPARLTPSQLQKTKLESGDLGRKTKTGFYQYT